MKSRSERTELEMKRGRAAVAEWKRVPEIQRWIKGSPAPNRQLTNFVDRAVEAGVAEVKHDEA